MGRTVTRRERKPAPPDPASCSSEEAARILGVGYNTFNRWWNPARRGWDIPHGTDTVFVVSIGYPRRRAPRARLIELAAYGRTGEVA